MKKLILAATCLLPAMLPTAALAYVGPGAGLSLLGALWALLAAVMMALLFILAWPLRRMMRRRRLRQQQASAQSSARAASQNDGRRQNA